MRLEKYIHFRPTAAMVDIIVKIMVEVISILGIVTKEIKQSRTSMAFLIDIARKVDLWAEKYLKKLAGRTNVEDAFERLDKLTPEEALMAAADTMTVTRDIDDTVKDMDKRLEGVTSNVLSVNERVKGVNEGVKDANEKVKDVDQRVKDVDKRLQDTDDRVKGVDGRVGSVIQGRLSFPPLALAPNLSSPVTPVRRKGVWGSDPTGLQTSQRPQP